MQDCQTLSRQVETKSKGRVPKKERLSISGVNHRVSFDPATHRTFEGMKNLDLLSIQDNYLRSYSGAGLRQAEFMQQNGLTLHIELFDKQVVQAAGSTL